MEHRNDAEVAPLFARAFLKRPPEELYDLRKDPHQLENVASTPEYAEAKKQIIAKLDRYLKRTGDPRITKGKIIWDTQRYYTESDFVGRPREEAIKKFHLKPTYDYMEK